MSEPSSYKQILRATSIFGLASAINIFFQIIRTKVLAVLLGPSGMGLFGMLSSILTTASSIASMGVSSSAVREIADARSNSENQRVGEVIYVLRILTIGLGALGAAATFILQEPIAKWTFGDTTYASTIGWLSIGIFVTVAGQSLSAMLQGYRLIGAQARLQVWSAAATTVLAITAITWLKQDGIIIFILLTPMIVMLLGWYYTKRIDLAPAKLRIRPFVIEAKKMIGLGFAIMVAATLQGWALLALRSHITQSQGIEATGLFQAAWALSFVYMGFMFEAMGKDYYPHLSENVNHPEVASQLMREQINVALILTSPFVIGMIGFASFILDVMYASSFRDAAPMIQWMGIGNLFKVVSWPLGFLVLAQGKKGLFIALEISWVLIFIGSTWLLLNTQGLVAVGVGFVTSYFCNATLLYLIARKFGDFGFDKNNLKNIAVSFSLVLVAFLATYNQSLIGYGIAFMCLVISGWHSYGKLAEMLKLSPAKHILAKFNNKY